MSERAAKRQPGRFKTRLRDPMELSHGGRGNPETLGATDEPTAAGLSRIQEYNTKIAEFVGINLQSQMDFVQRLATAKTPVDFVTMINDHSSRQIHTLTRQAEELVTLVEEIASEETAA